MLLSKKDSDGRSETAYSDLKYWYELRYRLMRTIGVIVAVSAISGFFYDYIWTTLLAQIRSICPELKIVSRSVLGPASLTLGLSGGAGLLAGTFWVLAELWCFIRPALFPAELRLIKYLGLSFIVLCSLLQYLCFAFLLPLTLSFFISFNKTIVESSVDLYELATFALYLHQGVLLISIWPYILFFLAYSGWLSLNQLRQNRSYIYVGSFIIGMILTPPDVISQCFFSIPLILLYESVLMLLSFTIKDTPP